MPLAWAILEGAAIAAPTTIEVFLHHRFGARSGKALLKAFLLLLVVYLVSVHGGPPASVPLFPGFLFAYIIVATGHWLTSRFRPIQHIHSHSTGEPWPLWRQLRVETATVQRYFEPALCGLIAAIVAPLDPALGYWLFLATLALFIKEQVSRARRRARRLDALDSRIETERLTPRERPEDDAFVEARPAPPRPARHRRPA